MRNIFNKILPSTFGMMIFLGFMLFNINMNKTEIPALEPNQAIAQQQLDECADGAGYYCIPYNIFCTYDHVGNVVYGLMWDRDLPEPIEN